MSNIRTQSWLIDRRHALRAMGTCISLPFLECMIPLNAAEQQTQTPRRSAFVYLANGVHSLNYQITTPGKDYEFSRSLKPLEKYREVVTPVSGLHHPGSLGHHHNCINIWLTGGKIGVIEKKHQKMAHKERALLIDLTTVAEGGKPCHFITNLHFAFHDGHTLYLVMDLALGGTLKYHLKKSHPKGFPEAQARFYAAQIASGLQYLHSKLILYRDCKPENM